MRSALWGSRKGLVLIALACWFAADARAEGWRDDFESAETEARQRNLPMLVHFTAAWCSHCQEMEQTVFRDPVLLRQLRTGFVGVKLNSDKRADLRERFHVTVLPTDLFFDSRGYLLERATGAHDRESYLGLVARMESLSSQSQRTRIVSETKPLGPVPPPLAPNPINARGPIDSRGVEPVPIAAAIAGQPGWDTGARRPGRRYVSLGMKGFSPVSLTVRRQWIQGDQHYSAEFQGIVYFLSSAEESRRFKESPDRYAPKILGCDPVILDIADRAVPGDIRYAAFFEGDLYLFVSEKSRALFQQDPHRFARQKHVLKVDDLDEKRLE